MGYSIGVLTCCIVMVLAAQEEIDEQRQRASMIFLKLVGGDCPVGNGSDYLLSLRHSPEWIPDERHATGLNSFLPLRFFWYGHCIHGLGFSAIAALRGPRSQPNSTSAFTDCIW